MNLEELISPKNLKKGMLWNKPKTELMLQFEQETGRYAIYHGNITGLFIYWLFENNLKISNFTETKQFTKEHKKKLSERMSGENNSMYDIHRYGEDAPNYKGDNINSMYAIHQRAHQVDLKPLDGICAICGKVKNEYGVTKLVHSNKDHTYKLPINPDEWQWVHQSCHLKYDMEHGIMKNPIGKKKFGY